MTQPIVLEDAFKGYTHDQDKILPPSETVARFRKRLERINLNILHKTVRIDNGRLDIPVYFSVCGEDAAEVIGTRKQMGKGATAEQAEASAVMELAERFSFFSFAKNEKNFFLQKFNRMGSEAVSFDLIAKSVHDESDDLPVAKRVFEELTFKWTRAYNLSRRKEVIVPFDWFFAINEFNGPSAGNCQEEALLQGICEIVERHASAVISRNKLRVPGIRTASASDPMVVDMLSKYDRAGVQLYVSDFTLDMGIPSVGVLAYDPNTFPELSEIVWTAGTTPDPQKAFSRALTEVAQLSGDFDTASNYVASGLPKFKRLEEAGYVTAPDRLVDISSLPNIADDNMKLEVENSIAALADRGFDVLVIDTMHPRLKIPSFYTIVPGAHFRERAMNTSVGMFAAKHVVDNSEPRTAVQRLEHIDRTLPGKYYVAFYLGLCHLALEEPRKALACFERALDLEPGDQDIPSIYSYMGVALKEMGDYRQALKVLHKGRSYDADRTDIHNLMGFCHFKLKEHEAAIENFKTVIRLNPASAIDYANIGANYRELGNRRKAIQYFEMAVSLDPGIEFARQGLDQLQAEAPSSR